MKDSRMVMKLERLKAIKRDIGKVSGVDQNLELV